MNKKLIIGGVVLLLIVGGGIFYFLGGTKDEFSLFSIYGTWSGKDDYTVKPLEGGQFVQNQRFGFQFYVPPIWKLSERGDTARFVLVLQSPDRVFDSEQKVMKRGCEFAVEAFESDIGLVHNTKVDLYFLQNEPESSRTEDKRLVGISGYSAVYEKNVVPLDWEEMDKNRWLDQISIPLTDERLLKIILMVSDIDREKCMQDFDVFLNRIQIEGTQELSDVL